MARRSDHTREQIHQMALEAAEHIVDQEGMSGLSARKVATSIGYTVGTLYLVFKNLDDLILQVNDRTLTRLQQTLEQAAAGQCSPEACVMALCHAYIDFASNNTARWSMIYEHRGEDGFVLPKAFKHKIQQSFELVENALQPLAKGKTDNDISKAARALWGGIHGICILSLTGTLDIVGVDSVQDLTDTLINNFLIGYKKTAS